MKIDLLTLSRRSAVLVPLGLAVSALTPARAVEEEEEEEEDVSATEDLMREHGVLRRALIVYREAVPLVRSTPATIDAGALADAADLFKVFGENYHERLLEEEHVFPAVRPLGGEAASLVDILLAQHKRGRKITSFIKEKCISGKITSGDAKALADSLESFARMYEPHAAYEDTIVFQAWKNSMSEHQLEETGEQFEEIEHKEFGGDGFDIAVDRIADIERRLGLHDLSRYTAPAPA